MRVRPAGQPQRTNGGWTEGPQEGNLDARRRKGELSKEAGERLPTASSMVEKAALCNRHPPPARKGLETLKSWDPNSAARLAGCQASRLPPARTEQRGEDRAAAK